MELILLKNKRFYLSHSVRAALIRFQLSPSNSPFIFYEYIDSQCSWQVACPSLLIKNCDVYQHHLKQQTSVPNASMFRVIVNAHLFVSQTILDITPKCPTIYSIFGNRLLDRKCYNLLLAKKKTAGNIFEKEQTLWNVPPSRICSPFGILF